MPASSTAYEAQAADIEARLRAIGDPAGAAGAKQYLKSDLEFIGVGVPAMRKLARAFAREHGPLDRANLIGLVEALWAQPVHEQHSVAIELLGLHKELLEAGDIEVVERLLRDSYTWAYVDPLSIDVAGAIVERYPEINAMLDRWATDKDFWVRRASMLALLRPIRRGAGDFERFVRYADSMIEEREFFIRKAIGWVLRETAKQRPDLVATWLAPRTHRASGVTMREAVKYLPAEQRERLMAAYREKRPAE